MPKTYTAALEDPYAAFRLFKAIEAQQNDVNDSSFYYFICTLPDADGRRHDPDRLSYLAP